MKFSIRLLYLYLFSFIGLLIAIIGSIQLVDLGIKVFIFKDADKYSIPAVTKVGVDGKETLLTEEEKAEQQKVQEEETRRQRQRQISNSLAMLIVGIPIYKYHWKTIQKEGKRKSN